MRVPAFVSGGFVPPARRGAAEPGVVHIADWLATLAGVAGVDASADARAGSPRESARAANVTLWRPGPGITCVTRRQPDCANAPTLAMLAV